MQRREAFYAELSEVYQIGWQPAPREYSTFSFCNHRCYLVGGLNYDTNKEVGELTFNHSQYDMQADWRNIKYSTNDDKIQGRCRHSACTYRDKVFIFGGSYMYNRKRQVRECTN